MNDLERFLAPQDETLAQAMAELRAGRKRTHWMWWVFPQLAALGFSGRSKRYGLAGPEEAAAYLAHPVLGPRLVEAARAMLAQRGRGAEAVLGPVDAAKMRSCATLFGRVPGADPVFAALLEAFFAGREDERTVALIAGGGGSAA